ncbi:hypothetical protein ACFLSP_00795 [Bacteroidota bacterium]
MRSKFDKQQRSYFQIGEVGYIGAGSKIAVFTRRSKPAFARLKQIYGDHLENLKLSKADDTEVVVISKAEKELIKIQIRKEFRAEVIKRIIILAVSIILTVVAVYFLIWLIKALLNADIPK